jgi:putative transposase
VVEAEGGPLGLASAGANGHDTKRLAETREAIGVARPEPTAEAPQHRCVAKGDDHPTGHHAAVAHHDTPPMRRIGEAKFDEHRRKRHPARRWVVERTLGWLSKGRALFVRYDKYASNFLGVLQLACALLWLRRRARLIRD